MEDELAHAKAVSRRLVTLRIIGLLTIVAIIALTDTHIARNYIFLCAGCALIQMAYLDFPKPIWLKLIAFISLILELWLGFHLLSWLSTLIILVVTTFGINLLFARLPWLLTGIGGLVLSVVAIFIIFG
jgi:hypothetical protein